MDITDLAIAQLVGQSAFLKGQTYQRQGRVRSILRQGNSITASVRGSGGNRYEAEVEVQRGANNRLIVVGTCSCSVGRNCKHVAAALVEARQQGLLADDMGLGKTLQALALIASEKAADRYRCTLGYKHQPAGRTSVRATAQ